MISFLIAFLLFSISLSKTFWPYDPFKTIDLDSVILAKTSINIPFTLSETHQVIVQVCIGTPKKCYPFKLATNMNECFIYDKSITEEGYDYTESFTGQVIDSFVSFEHAYRQYEGFIAKDTFSIPNSKIEIAKFPFYVINKGEVSQNYVGVLAIGKKYLDYSFSVLCLLYSANQINHLYFTLYYEGNGGYIKLGYHDASDEKEYKSCPITEEEEEDGDPYFQSMLTSIIFDNSNNDPNDVIVYNKPQDVWFSPGAIWMYCPDVFYSFLIKHLFKKYIDDDMCNLEMISIMTRIRCQTEILDKDLGELMFIFGKWNIKEKISDLFTECNGSVCLEIVVVNGESKWILGYPFLKKYPLFINFDDEVIKIKTRKSHLVIN